MPTTDKQIYVKVDPAFYQTLEHHWRFETSYRHMSDAVRELVRLGLPVATPAMLAALDAYAAAHGMTREDALRHLVSTSLDLEGFTVAAP